MKLKILFWFLAFIITAAVAIYQRTTGPTYPVSGEILIDNEKINYTFSRSHGGEANHPVQIIITNENLKGILYWKRFKTDDDWKKVEMHSSQESVTFQNIFDRLRNELQQSTDELGSHGVDDEEVIETAINLENHARFYYAESAKKATDEKVKEFLETLAQEEEGHYKALRNMNNFMADPANWFATQGKF